ncbi:MFS transporter [Novosphingobium nitrogenifigens]|uniref:MFS transporter n=1 Tax=Novosphingobium nitrogenifigens TaxID=378548 RepID=UPI00037ABDEF|nr:MFS transporter [Novosphingobium nitrogenifigens]
MAKSRALTFGEALYVQAYVGAYIAFMPLLVLLLPRRVALITVAGGSERLLSLLVLVGGVVASLANIVAGHMSDKAMVRRGDRRLTLASGLVCLIATYGVLAVSFDPLLLILGVVAFQIAVNLLLSPMGALISDYIPDQRKGRVAGFLNCALPLATGAVGLVAWVAPVDGLRGFWGTLLLVTLCVAPLLVLWPFGVSRAQTGIPFHAPPAMGPLPVRNIVLAWWARFLLQLGATLLTNYLYPYIAFLTRGGMGGGRWDADGAVGWLSLWAALAACCGAVAAGRWSDILSDRRKLMAVSALLAALALAGFALAPGWRSLALSYAVLHLALAAFFSVEAAFVAEMIATSGQRGRLLGYMNLANTLPAILIAVTAMQAGRHALLVSAMPLVLLACACAGVLAAVLCLAMIARPRGVRQHADATDNEINDLKSFAKVLTPGGGGGGA